MTKPEHSTALGEVSAALHMATSYIKSGRIEDALALIATARERIEEAENES